MSVVTEVLGLVEKVSLILNHLQCTLTPKYTHSMQSHLIKRLMKWKDVNRAKRARLSGCRCHDSTSRCHGYQGGLASFFLSFLLESLSLVTLTLSHWQAEIRNSISPYLVMVGW